MVLNVASDRVAKLRQQFLDVRDFSHRICQPLEVEDFVVQSMPDVSPTRWHLAHTTWFFETFVLSENDAEYSPVNPSYEYLFNSYYNTVGKQFPRSQRGLVTRPTVAEVFAYRDEIDRRILDRFDEWNENSHRRILDTVEIGLHHEQQHQELMVTDIKHVLSTNPLHPAYHTFDSSSTVTEPSEASWIPFPAGLCEIGTDSQGFSFDNERPRHRVYVPEFELASGPVTCKEFLSFIEDGGYARSDLWLSLGWYAVGQQQWQAPLYWMRTADGWQHFTLGGLKPLNMLEPVCHVSYFEADAYARWAGARLPLESEWEQAALEATVSGHFSDESRFHPQPSLPSTDRQPHDMFGNVWEWTASPYVAYPGYVAADGALGEYNGKFMCNQYVLRGGSCATPASHIRPTYRNFFAPDTRWQFSGLRLAR